MIRRDDYEYAQDYIDALIRRDRNIRRMKRGIIAAVIMTVVVGTATFLLTYYRVRNTQISGNSRYTNKEIQEMVTGGFLSDNSLVLSLKYRNKRITNVPFIEQMDVTVVTHDTIKITVYEKSIAGYVDYLGTNFYFGRDGTVVESSKDVVEGVPRITGLEFDHIALYEQLPVEDPDIFGRILNVTQLLSKYDLAADSIYFDGSGSMTIYFGDVRILMGNDDYMDEKLSNVSRILPSLDGRGAGTLRMSEYTPSSTYITYELRDGKVSDVTTQADSTALADTEADVDPASAAGAAGSGNADSAGTTTGTADTTSTGTATGTADTTSAGAVTGTTSPTMDSVTETTNTTTNTPTGTADTSSTGTTTETTDSYAAGTATGTADTTSTGTATGTADTASEETAETAEPDVIEEPEIPAEAVEITDGME